MYVYRASAGPDGRTVASQIHEWVAPGADAPTVSGDFALDVDFDAAGWSSWVDVLRRAAAATVAAMPQLERMAKLREYWVHVNSLEDEGDAAYRQLLGDLLVPDGDVSAIDVLTIIKVKEIVEVLEEAADAFETVANTVESIALKES